MDGDAWRLEAQVLEAVQTKGLAQPGDTVLVAVSGGADSVALLAALHALRGPLGVTIHAAHYEHGIRAEASRADAGYVQALCARLGVPCQMGEGDVPALRAAWKCSLEDAARRARYAFLEAAAARAGASVIALAHQLEDQAETMLLHLVHGCGLQGLRGMRARQGNRIRPLLEIPRAALEAYLIARGIPWREDATNADTAHARNLLRHSVFPHLRQLNPRVAQAMARTAVLAGRAADQLERAAAQDLAGRTKRMPYGAFWEPARTPSPEAVRLFAARAGVPALDARQTDGLVGITPGKTANLPGGWRALRTPRRLHLLKPAPDAARLDEGDIVRTDAPPGWTGDGVHTQAVDAEALEGAVFRFRRPGDVFAPLGGGTQKLKQTLMDAGIDRPFRDMLPLLARDNRVLWIVGLKAGRDAAVGPDTRRAVRLTYAGSLPWALPADTPCQAYDQGMQVDGGTDDD